MNYTLILSLATSCTAPDKRVIELPIQPRALILALSILDQVPHIILTHVMSWLAHHHHPSPSRTVFLRYSGILRKLLSRIASYGLDELRVDPIPEPGVALRVLKVGQYNASVIITDLA